jgi:sterol desaturase/sphingolipid hydroxylase (fatty acid hydroxylase superfamily)
MWLTYLSGTLAIVAIVALRYLAISGGFAALTRRLHPSVYVPADPDEAARLAHQIRREIAWSLSAAVIYGIPAGVVAVAWREYGLTQIYADPGAYGWVWLPLSIIIYLFVHDSYFYWSHRLMHRPALFARIHAVHHESRPPTAWAAMSFHPWESLSGALLIPALALLIPIHWAALAVVLTVMTFFGVTNHMGWEIFPRSWLNGVFGRVMITASHHHLHHRHYRCNYGLYFRFWDRLCGTDRGLAKELTHA